jgi:cytochrome P450
MRRSVLFD